jgi:PHD/YefM family antitoxin component YafN of YafNO toxin-antitoxin module
MISVNITSFRKSIFSMLEQTIKHNEAISISTKAGNAVIISEDDYNGLMETLYLSSIPKLKKTIVEGLQTPLDECISESDVEW